MAAFSPSRYLTALSLLFLYFKTLSAYPNSSFSFKNFDKDSNFESQLALYGDAKIDNGGSSVQLTGSSSSSAGRLIYKKPIKLGEGNPKRMVSFSSYFSFSISPENGDGLAFVMFPIGFPLNVFDGSSFGLLVERKIRVFTVEFDTSRDDKYGDLNSNHVGIDIGSLVSVKVANVSSINLVLNSGEKLQAWIDYEVGSKRLEVRLSKLGEIRPEKPLLWCPFDLSQIWREEEVIVGLSSSNANSSQKCIVLSWSFKLRQVPSWMHSQPLDPKAFSENTKALRVPKRSDCVQRVLGALIFGTGCGALGAFLVLLAWTTFGNRRPVVPEEFVMHPVECDYKKFKVVVDKPMEDGKK
ncbi:L-type lectin-domain containing receptor kinase VIII.2-like [Cornus florida]|uniref:L-type lectin-domain containing receptor kinase VIII.2-like n=1 Tax=Cornus florida TaxID=4283 RepID=UPI002897F87B|nr:L-type lectin-domain containing receptor kinase VIII.2-like [Cornus florida]